MWIKILNDEELSILLVEMENLNISVLDNIFGEVLNVSAPFLLILILFLFIRFNDFGTKGGPATKYLKAKI